MTIDAAPLAHSSAKREARPAGYQVSISTEGLDPRWDEFVAATPGGHPAQSSLWVGVKSVLGWKGARVVLRQDGQIVAGAQILYRRVAPLVTIGYCSKGPLLAREEPALLDTLMREIRGLARALHLPYLTLQPPNNGWALAEKLGQWGFRPGLLDFAPVATILIDLSQELDEILAGMHSRTRYNVRLSQRKGIQFRVGDGSDLAPYYRLLQATAERQEFRIFSEEYYQTMWALFAPHGYVQLFAVDYEGETLSMQLALTFGDTVINLLTAWSGQQGALRPNEALYFGAMRWAREHGFRYYNLEGIDPVAARAALAGQPLPEDLAKSVTSFKLGFGGEITFLPGPYDYLPNPVLSWGYHSLLRGLAARPQFEHYLQKLRFS